MELIKLPVLKRTKQYTCGQWSFVYPPFKGAKTMNTKHEDLIKVSTLKNYTVTSQNCVKLLSDLEHGTMFIFPDKPEQLCLVVTSMDGVYSFVDLTFGNLYEIKDRGKDATMFRRIGKDREVNPVSHFKGQITLA